MSVAVSLLLALCQCQCFALVFVLVLFWLCVCLYKPLHLYLCLGTRLVHECAAREDVDAWGWGRRKFLPPIICGEDTPFGVKYPWR